jgi:hypothetical protein
MRISVEKPFYGFYGAAFFGPGIRFDERFDVDDEIGEVLGRDEIGNKDATGITEIAQKSEISGSAVFLPARGEIGPDFAPDYARGGLFYRFADYCFAGGATRNAVRGSFPSDASRAS